ncbi:retrovirus-related pol polyprotein from transposon TNT 1-94 [Tanacetum coccineum]
MLNANSKLTRATCNECMFDAIHDLRVLDFVNDVNVHSKSKSAKSSKKKKIWKPTSKVYTDIGYRWKRIGHTFTLFGNACTLTRFTFTRVASLKKTTSKLVITQNPAIKVYSRRPKVIESVVQIVLWYLDSGCSKHMTGNRSQLINFGHKFLGTVRFGNDQIAKIMGYGDYQMGNVTISQGSRGSNLYTLSLEDVMLSSPICLLSKASKAKSWLWHRSKKHFHKPKAEDSIQEKLYLLHMDLCRPIRIQSINGWKYILVIIDDYYRTNNGTEFVNQTLRAYYEDVGISHQTSVARIPQQNGIMERRNRTLVEATHIMLIFSKAPLSLWEADISSGLVQNPPSLTLYVPPTKKDWDNLFQPMFDEYFNPPPSVASPVPAVVAPEPDDSTGTPSSTFIDQDEPSLSTYQTSQETKSLVIPSGVEEQYHDIKVAHLDNDPFFSLPIL